MPHRQVILLQPSSLIKFRLHFGHLRMMASDIWFSLNLIMQFQENLQFTCLTILVILSVEFFARNAKVILIPFAFTQTKTILDY